MRNRRIQIRFVTNMTGHARDDIAAFLEGIGIEAYASEVHTSVDASLRYIDENYFGKAGFLVLPEPLKARFSHIETSETSPDFVLIGDNYDEFNNKLLDRIYLYLQQGSSLITFHKNVYCFKDGKRHLDSGAYTRLLEDATGLEACVTGKPSPMFFELAMKSLDLPKSQILVIGDDVETDILGDKIANFNQFWLALENSKAFNCTQVIQNQASLSKTLAS